MPVHHGASAVNTFKVGTAQVDKLYLGTTEVWASYVAATASISDLTVDDQADSPTDAYAAYSLNSDGTGWLTGGDANDCEVLATQVSDTTSGAGTSRSGFLDVWLALDSTRTWSVSATANANTGRTWVIDLTIRRISDMVVLDTARITLSASTSLP